MAVSIFYFAHKKTTVGGATDVDLLELDAALSINHQLPSQTTQHPVEKGADPTDHIRILPEKVTIEGIVSNTPLPKDTAKLTKLFAGSVEYASRGEADRTRIGKAFSKLKDFRTRKRLLKVATPLETYDNMVLVDIGIPQTSKDGQALRMTLSFERIRVVSNQTIKLNTKVAKAKKKDPQGQKQGTQIDDRGPALTLTQEGYKAMGKTVPEWLLSANQKAGVFPK